MTLLVASLLLALTRAEIIERMRAAPVTKVSGLVEVIADCPSDMRKEYQTPIAGFVADVCTTLYRGRNERQKTFKEPGIVVYLGEERTNRTDVVVRTKTRSDGSRFTRIYLPAPGYADIAKLRRESVKAFLLAVHGESVDDATADKVMRDADPVLRAADAYAELDRWLKGESVSEDDEHYIRLSRAVLRPGVATTSDVLRFASRLRIYPEIYSAPFCGRYASCTFKEAIDLSREDLRIRFLAYAKSPEVVLYGGGRGESLADAAVAYSEFLRELAAYRKTPEELRQLLETAEEKLNVALEEARLREEGKIQ